MAASGLILPSVPWVVTATPSISSFTLSSAGHRLALVFGVPASITPTAVLMRLGVKTGTTPTYQVSIQALDASGNPSGTDLCTPATFSPSSLSWADGTTRWISVSGASALSPDNLYCAVITYSSGTVDGSNNASFATSTSGVSPTGFATPYNASDANVGSWTKNGNTTPSFVAVRDASNTYGLAIFTGASTATAGSAGNRVCQKFTFPSTWGQSISVAGLLIPSMQVNSGGSIKFGIWDAAGSAVASSTLDSDQQGNTGQPRVAQKFFSSPASLSLGTTYYAGVERVGSLEPNPRYFDHADSRDTEAYPFGSGSCLSTWNGSAWSDTATAVMLLSLLLGDWTVASGGGNVFFIGG